MAAGYLLDTNVISETRKTRADGGVMAFLSAADAAGLFLSVLTLGELRKGVETKRRTDPGAAERLGAWVDGIETILRRSRPSRRCRGREASGRTVGRPEASRDR